MGGNGVKSIDFYQVLGLEKGCSETELKNAYKKLALVIKIDLEYIVFDPTFKSCYL